MMCARVSTTPTQFSSNSRTKRRQQGERPGDTHGKHDDRTCGLRADTRGIDEIDLMEEASTGRLKAPTDGAKACVNAAKFDQLGSRIRIGPVDFSPPPLSRLAAHFLHRGAVRTGTIFNLNGHSHHARTPVLPERGAGRAGVNGKGEIRCCWAGEIPPSKRGYGRRIVP